MAKDCGCGATQTKPAPGTWTVHNPDMSSQSYRSEVEAIAAAARTAGAYVLPG